MDDELRDEAWRLARKHLHWGVPLDLDEVQWQPQHAVPRHPRRDAMTDAEIDARVAADLAHIDHELDPRGPRYIRHSSIQILPGHSNIVSVNAQGDLSGGCKVRVTITDQTGATSETWMTVDYNAGTDSLWNAWAGKQ